MRFYWFRVKTTQKVILTVSTSRDAVMGMVMASEGCPRAAIKSVRRLKRIA